ncbi:hypothetical protein MKW98_028922 [Papaver atlanticum]|uniref:Uncharacterized protein n=1 Tax=Papaver atlanticum TaxID=357466 RepID=A0AAD4S3D4_9MAGN|nr:hypothetical protein MKW98_028922 [Papaver atlanticum]
MCKTTKTTIHPSISSHKPFIMHRSNDKHKGKGFVIRIDHNREKKNRKLLMEYSLLKMVTLISSFTDQQLRTLSTHSLLGRPSIKWFTVHKDILKNFWQQSNLILKKLQFKRFKRKLACKLQNSHEQAALVVELEAASV